MTEWMLAIALLAEGAGGPGSPEATIEERREDDFRRLREDGLDALSQEDWSRCAESLRQATGVRPDALTLRALAICYAAEGRIVEAVESLERAVFYSPDDPGLLASLGSVYLALGMLRAAEYRLSEAIALDPGAAYPRYLRLCVWQRVGESPQLDPGDLREVRMRIVLEAREVLACIRALPRAERAAWEEEVAEVRALIGIVSARLAEENPGGSRRPD